MQIAQAQQLSSPTGGRLVGYILLHSHVSRTNVPFFGPSLNLSLGRIKKSNQIKGQYIRAQIKT